MIIGVAEPYSAPTTEQRQRNLDAMNEAAARLLEGQDAFRQQAEQALALFSERERFITNFNHAGNQTEIAITYRARMTTDLPNGMKKGDVLELSGKSVFTFSGNKVVKLEDFA